MKNWTKEEALNAMQSLIDQIPNVSKSGRKSQNHMRWLANSLRVLEGIFGGNSRYYLTLANFSWQQSGNMAFQSRDIEGAIAQRHHQAFLEQMNQASGLLLAAKDHLEHSKIEQVYEGKDTPDETSEL